MDYDEDYDEVDHVEDAESYEELAAEFPQQRGFLLLNAADAWMRAGRWDRFLEVLTSVAAGAGEPAGYARVELADIALMAGRRGEADRLLAELALDTGLGDGPCEIAAMVLARHGDRPGAVRWYDHFAGRLARLAELRDPDGGRATVVDGLRRRRDLRRHAGLPPDAVDDLVDGRRP